MPMPPFLADLRRKVGHALLLLPTIVVIARDSQGRLLLVHDADSGLWTVPGGIIEPGEAPADTAVREVWEEAGVRVQLTGLIGVIGGPGCETHYRNGDRLAWVASVFAAVTDTCVPVADGQETRAAGFFSAAQLQALSIRADSRRFLALEQQASAAGGAVFEAPGWQPPAA